jgi:hypothetical protein
LKKKRNNNAKVTIVGVGEANKDDSEQRAVSYIKNNPFQRTTVIGERCSEDENVRKRISAS